jgi:hypothetical protein
MTGREDLCERREEGFYKIIRYRNSCLQAPCRKLFLEIVYVQNNWSKNKPLSKNYSISDRSSLRAKVALGE